MKKLLLLTLFAFFSISFTNANAVTSELCIDYAVTQLLAEEEAFGDMGHLEWLNAAIYYYNLCEEDNNVSDAVFIVMN